MDVTKIIKAKIGHSNYVVADPIMKEDYGLYLLIEGIELPQSYEVDFSNELKDGTSVTMIGDANGVRIPEQFIQPGRNVYAFYYHVGSDFGRTLYTIRIPNSARPERTDETPTPVQQSAIDQAISALNTAVERTAQDVLDADQSAQDASEDAGRAEAARDAAEGYAQNASGSASAAATSASQASTSAQSASQSASQSAQIKTDVEGMVDGARASAAASAQSASAAYASASSAATSAQTATTKAAEASTSASNAATSASTAGSKASEASASAATASAKASEAAQSATSADTAKTDAQTAKTAAQTAQTAAETAQTAAEDAQEAAETAAQSIEASAAQIATNTADIADVKRDLTNLDGSAVKTVNNIAPDTNGNVNVEGGGEAVTDTVTGESVTFVTNDTSPKTLTVTLESTIPDTSGATPSSPVSITGVTSETITVNGTDKVISLTNPIGKGTWNVLSGTVVDERPVVDFTGDMVSSLAKVDSIYAMAINVGNPISANGILACSHYPVYKTGAIVWPVIRYINGKYYLYDNNITENNLQTARDYISNLGAKLVLDVVTPVELSETPETITLVNGENTVSVSNGELSLTYTVDIKGYVDGKVASVADTAEEALETANGLDARVTANKQLSESNEQNVYKFRTDTGSNTGTDSAGTAETIRWGFHLDIDADVEKCYSITFTPSFPSSVTGQYTATRWKKESGTLENGDILTKVDEITKAVGESVTFEKLGTNEFVSLNKSCYRTTIGNGANFTYVNMGYINENTGAFTSFSGYLSGTFSVTFYKPIKDDSMPLYGKKITLVGDSITEKNGRANTNHGMWLNKWTGCEIQNLGVGGTGFSTRNKYKDRISSINTDADLIGVAASLNDMRNTVGTASDTAEDATVCGYANEFFDLLLTAFPTTPIVCYSEGPWYYYKPNVEKSDTYMTEMKKICEAHGVAWDDGLYRGCALRPWIQDNCEVYYKGESGSYTDVVDNIHPNSAGQHYIARFLKYLFEKYI